MKDDDEEDEDDIFAIKNSEDNKVNIEIGKKLEFGVDDNIFSEEKREKPI